MCFLAIAFLAHGVQHVTEDRRRALRLHIRFPSPLKRIDRALIAVLRCSSLSTVVMSASSTCFSRIRRHAALLGAADRCQLPRQLPRAQSFAIDYHLFSPLSRAFLCPRSLPGPVGRLASLGACGLFGGAVSGCVVVLPVRRPVSFYSSGELSVPIFVRGIRRPLPLSPVVRCRLLCAVRCSFGSRRCACVCP